MTATSSTQQAQNRGALELPYWRRYPCFQPSPDCSPSSTAEGYTRFSIHLWKLRSFSVAQKFWHMEVGEPSIQERIPVFQIGRRISDSLCSWRP